MGCGHGDGSMEINPHVDCPLYQSTDSPIPPYAHCPIYHQLSHTPITPYTHCVICPLPHFPIVLYVHFLYFHCTTHRFPLYVHWPTYPLSHSSIAPYAHCAISFLLHTSVARMPVVPIVYAYIDHFSVRPTHHVFVALIFADFLMRSVSYAQHFFLTPPLSYTFIAPCVHFLICSLSHTHLGPIVTY